MSSERAGVYQRINRGEFTVSVELNPIGSNPAVSLARYAHQLQEFGQNIVDINDRPNSSALDIAKELMIVEPKIIVFPHIATGNHTKDALLRGITNSANEQGLDNFLIVGGDRVDKDRGQIFRPTEAISAIRAINAQLDKPIFLAAAFNQNAKNLQREEETIRAKVDAGADFFLSQVVFSPSQLDQAAGFFHQHSDKSLVVGVWPISSFAIVRRIHSGSISGIVIPEEDYGQYSQTRFNQDQIRDLGLKKAKNLVEYARSSGKVQGVYIVAPHNPEDVAKLIT